MKCFTVFFLLCILFCPTFAYAYIDPGTGSLILQALVAGCITCLIFIRRIRDKIVSLFKRNNDQK